MVFGSGIKTALVALFAAACLGGGGARAQSEVPAPLEAYGATPAVEHIVLSPSGELVARISVEGEVRAIAVTRVSTHEVLFASRVGDIKVRDLRWVGEGRVLIITSQTRDIPSLGVPRSELFFGQLLDLETKSLVQVLSRTPEVLAVLYGPASVRQADDGDALLVRAINVTNDRVDLYRIDLRTGRGRSVRS